MKYKSNKTKFGAIALILILLIVVGLLGWVTKGFANWDVTKWFAKEETKTEELEEETAEINFSASALSTEPFLTAYLENDILYFNFSSGGYDYGDGIMVSLINKNNLTEDFLVWGLEPHVIYELTEELISFMFAVPVEYSTILSGLSIPLTDLDFSSFENLNDVIIVGSAFSFGDDSFNVILYSSFISLSDNFEITYYKVTLNANGGIFNFLEEPSEVLTLDIQHGFSFYHIPERTGYVFKGWKLNGEFYNMSQPVVSDLTLIAEWAPQTFSIAFVGNGGTFKNGTELIYVDVSFGSALAYPEVYRAGYKLTGWVSAYPDWLNEDGFVIRNSSLTAQWELAYYDVILNVNGGYVEKTMYTISGNNYFIPPVPTRAGYHFLGWYSNGILYNENNPVISNLTLIAEWEPIIYVVQFNSNGGKVIEPVFIQHGNILNLPTPERAGYTFKGWKLNGSLYTASPVLNNLYLVAEWEIKIFTITFNANGGICDITAIQVAYDNTFNLPTPERTGYIFKGWKLNGKTYVESPATENMTLTASWDIIKLTVTFYVNNEAYKSILVDYGTTLYQLRQKSNELFLNIKSISFENLEDIGKEFIVTDNVLVIAEKQNTVQSFWSVINQYWYFVVAGIGVLALIGYLIYGNKKGGK